MTMFDFLKGLGKTVYKRALLVGLILAALLASIVFYQDYKHQQELQALDGLVYTFIVGKVEGNDDLLSDILTEKAQGIIKPGRHAYPGDAEKMGNRYSIIRWDNKYKEGAVFYEVEFYRPSSGKVNVYNVLVLNTKQGWKIAENTSTDETVMQLGKMEEAGTVVHAYGIGKE